MTNDEFATYAEQFVTVPTFYAKGGFMQPCNTQAQYDALCKQYDWNMQHKKSSNVSKRPVDCICFIKGVCWNARAVPVKYPTYASNGMPDVTDQRMGDSLQNCVKPSEAKRGMVLWKKGHVGVALGGGRWIDANYCTGQDGVKIHESGIETFTKAGEMPWCVTYTYEEQGGGSDAGGSERDVLRAFCDWMIDSYLAQK